MACDMHVFNSYINAAVTYIPHHRECEVNTLPCGRPGAHRPHTFLHKTLKHNNATDTTNSINNKRSDEEHDAKKQLQSITCTKRALKKKLPIGIAALQRRPGHSRQCTLELNLLYH